jgi:hypothetical protein
MTPEDSVTEGEKCCPSGVQYQVPSLTRFERARKRLPTVEKIAGLRRDWGEGVPAKAVKTRGSF